jgi:hypothetical protein
MGVTATYSSVVFGPPPGAAANRLLSKGILPSRAAEDSPRGEESTGSMLATRRGGDLNPRNPFEFTRSAGVRLDRLLCGTRLREGSYRHQPLLDDRAPAEVGVGDRMG